MEIWTSEFKFCQVKFYQNQLNPISHVDDGNPHCMIHETFANREEYTMVDLSVNHWWKNKIFRSSI